DKGLRVSIDVIKVPEKHVRERRGDAHVRGDEVCQVRSSQPRHTVLLQGLLIDGKIRAQDHRLVVGVIVRGVRVVGEQQLGEEGEILRIPDIPVVDSHEEDDASQVADERIGQRIQRVPQRRSERGNVIPIERHGH
ncbi:hypothetical protein T310_9785, partial [Rasamsonia emersonii CBS 393.64]